MPDRYSQAYKVTDFEAVIDAIARREVGPRPVHTSTVSLDALPAAFDALARSSEQCKVLSSPDAVAASRNLKPLRDAATGTEPQISPMRTKRRSRCDSSSASTTACACAASAKLGEAGPRPAIASRMPWNIQPIDTM